MVEWLIWLGWGLLKIVGFFAAWIVAMAIVAGLFFIFIVVAGYFSRFFVREVNDPELGLVEIGLGTCDGKITIEGKKRKRFSLPAKKKEMSAEAKALLLRAKANWPALKAQLLEHFAAEVEEEGVPPDLIKRWKWVEKIARERDYENLERYTRLHEINVEHVEKNGPLELRIRTHHRWDPEHDRVLVLDDKLGFKLYALSCQC